jgi:ABC-2 type transport system permease protein
MKLLRLELTKLFAQRRSYVGWAGLLLVPMLMTLALYLNRNSTHHDNGPGGVITLAMHNGLLIPIAAITLLSAFLLPLLASMVGSYQLAGEAETGTIKTWLMHSISRGGVLASKWGVAVIYVAIGLALVAVGGFVAGALAFGLHAPVLLSGQTVGIGQGLWLSLLSYLYVFAGVICVLSLALLFATFTNSSLTAAIEALVVVIVMNILGAFSYFDFLKPYLFTSHLDAWQNLLSQPTDWHPIITGLMTFAIYIAGLMAAAWYQFRRKDILV